MASCALDRYLTKKGITAVENRGQSASKLGCRRKWLGVHWLRLWRDYCKGVTTNPSNAAHWRKIAHHFNTLCRQRTMTLRQYLAEKPVPILQSQGSRASGSIAPSSSKCFHCDMDLNTGGMQQMKFAKPDRSYLGLLQASPLCLACGENRVQTVDLALGRAEQAEDEGP